MSQPPRWTGILLAAGRGRRFDASGQQDKLLQILSTGHTVAQRSAINLLAAMPHVVAVLRPNQTILSAQLSALGAECLVCADADAGMAASLKHAVRATTESAGWLVALADMPFVKPDSIRTLLQALQGGADIVVPVHQGRRGHPVAFANKYQTQLLALTGDVGARSILQTMPVTEIEVDDPGIHQDIDVAEDLGKHVSGSTAGDD